MEQVRIAGKWYDVLAIAPKSIVVVKEGRVFRVRKHLVESYRLRPE
jgi:hypothetical protein